MITSIRFFFSSDEVLSSTVVCVTPREMGVADVEAFLSMLAHERKVSASTHNQSLSALLFLYREVLSMDLP